MIRQLLIYLALASIWSTSVFANNSTCRKENSIAAEMALMDLEKQLDEVIRKSPVKESDVRELRKTLRDANAASKHPNNDIDASVTQETDELVNKALAKLKGTVDEALSSIERGLDINADTLDEMLIASYQSGKKEVPIDDLDESAPENKVTIRDFRHQIAVIEASIGYPKAARDLIEKLGDKIYDSCLEKISFKAKSADQELSFVACAPHRDPANLEAEKWGGQIKDGDCRQIANCKAVTTKAKKQLPATDWIFDCKKKDGVCPEFEKCATQAKANGGQVRQSLPGGEVK